VRRAEGAEDGQTSVFGLETGSQAMHFVAMETKPPDNRSMGMPRWRAKQRAMPIGEKLELIGKFILETRRLEQLKKACKPSVTSSNNS
jgi:hypothetical protein